MAMGVPGWPELACWTASMARVRMALIQRLSADCGFIADLPLRRGDRPVHHAPAGTPAQPARRRRGAVGAPYKAFPGKRELAHNLSPIVKMLMGRETIQPRPFKLRGEYPWARGPGSRGCEILVTVQPLDAMPRGPPPGPACRQDIQAR